MNYINNIKYNVACTSLLTITKTDHEPHLKGYSVKHLLACKHSFILQVTVYRDWKH